MTDKCVKKCLAIVIKEMQVKTAKPFVNLKLLRVQGSPHMN